ncbi:MAG: 4a-hydroxytetrahydrobiopterin dehydratase [Microbacteriaceae bacterium]|jgi:4a-hydroxytetrahydrobiopterin dehydratase|nr:4a-hydroxytetrahydrobiopterin dehydratase [Microbacteriaceae bacterium]
MPALLDQSRIDEALRARHPDWKGTPEKLSRSMEFADFPTAVEFINRIAPRCEELDHHPDLALRWRWVDVELSTHSEGGVTELDLTLANIVDEVAADLPLAD